LLVLLTSRAKLASYLNKTDQAEPSQVELARQLALPEAHGKGLIHTKNPSPLAAHSKGDITTNDTTKRIRRVYFIRHTVKSFVVRFSKHTTKKATETTRGADRGRRHEEAASSCVQKIKRLKKEISAPLPRQPPLHAAVTTTATYGKIERGGDAKRRKAEAAQLGFH
jgi:hypothetical protein